MNREQFTDAFVAACEKQATLEAHTPEWKSLLELVWDEIAHLQEPYAPGEFEQLCQNGFKAAARCPYTWQGDDGSVKQCEERGHCGCDPYAMPAAAGHIAEEKK